MQAEPECSAEAKIDSTSRNIQAEQVLGQAEQVLDSLISSGEAGRAPISSGEAGSAPISSGEARSAPTCSGEARTAPISSGASTTSLVSPMISPGKTEKATTVDKLAVRERCGYKLGPENGPGKTEKATTA